MAKRKTRRSRKNRTDRTSRSKYRVGGSDAAGAAKTKRTWYQYAKEHPYSSAAVAAALATAGTYGAVKYGVPYARQHINKWRSEPSNAPTPKPSNTSTPKSSNTSTPRTSNASTPRTSNASTPRTSNASTPRTSNAPESKSSNISNGDNVHRTDIANITDTEEKI